MKITITADTGVQDIEITRAPARQRAADAATDQEMRLRVLDGVLEAAVHDVRRAAGLPADHEPGALLVAWRDIARLVGADDPQLPPSTVVERVAAAVEALRRAGRTLNTPTEA